MEIPLHSALFWIQIHNLPPGYMTSSTTQLLGKFVELFVEYDATVTSGGWQNFMRVRVEIDMRLPLNG